MVSRFMRTALAVLVTTPAAAFDVSRVSLDGAGDEIAQESRDAALSADGRYVVFTTFARLAAKDGNSFEDVYLRDRETGEVTLVSRPIGPLAADRPSRQPSISADGRRIVFTSAASNLVSGDNAGHSDVFLYIRESGALLRLTTGFDDTEANGASSAPQISGDGTVVAFQSDASNLVGDDTNDVPDIFIHSLVAGVTRRVSVASDGGQLSGRSGDPSVSEDGLKVAFSSFAREINPNGSDELEQAYVHDVITGRTTHIATSPDSISRTDAFRSPVLSPDGNWVAFLRTRVGGSGLSDIYLQHVLDGQTLRVTRPLGEAQKARHDIGGVARDGRWVAFDSIAGNLIAGDNNGENDVFRFFRDTGAVRRASGPGPNVGGNGESSALAITPDGRHVLFASRANNLVPGDTNGATDIFLNDLAEFAIDSAISGSWYDRDQDGHGFLLEYVGGDRLVFYWFTFTPGGAREWIFGVLDVNGTVASGQAFRQSGGRFPPNFDPAAITSEPWGTIRFEFSNCSRGSVSWETSPPFQDGGMTLSRLTAIPALACD